jgi:membrane protease YdiL (CAAX protease family)
MDDVHRPVTCLVFLLPLVLLYELGVFYLSGDISSAAGRVIAFQLLQKFLALFGATGYYLPGLAIIAILVAWQFASGDVWKFNPRTIAGMALESLMLAIPLLVLSHVASNYATSLSATISQTVQHPWLSELLISVGAGIYEELLFRLILITVLSILLIDVFNVGEGPAIFTIVLASAVIFSLYHYLGDESFGIHSFVFRTIAGGYLAGVFILRGFGITVGCHVVYDLVALLLNALQTD